MADSRVDKWRGWIEGRIHEEVVTMHLRRYVFQEVGEIIQANGQLPPSYYWQFMRDTYATTQAVAIRRQADPSSRVISLGRLAYEISEDAGRLTRGSFLELWEDDSRHYGEREFDRMYAGNVGAHLDPSVAQSHLAALTSGADSVKTYVNDFLAHSGARRAADAVLTFSDIDAATDQIGELFQRYAHLLTAKDYQLVPILRPDWMAIFGQPWIRS